MARTPTAQQIFDALLTRYEKDIADALATAFQDLRDNAQITRAIEALTRNDIQGFIDALNLEPAAFGPVDQAIQRAFTAGGQFGAAQVGAQATRAGLQFVIRFDGRNIRAENWIRDHSSTLVTRIIDDQRAAVRTALQAGMQAGANPRTTALDIVGRIDKATGKRTGGILGLSSPQEEYLRTARRELASGDPKLMQNYLQRTLRDKRFDRTVLKAIEDGKPVSGDVASRALTQYSNRMLKYRGDVIGLEESLTSLATAKDEAYQQAADKGLIAAQHTTKTWRHFPNEHPRTEHEAMDGTTVNMNQPFVLPDGTQMKHPHDPAGGAKQNIGCHCQADYRVDFLAGIR